MAHRDPTDPQSVIGFVVGLVCVVIMVSFALSPLSPWLLWLACALFALLTACGLAYLVIWVILGRRE